jgi:hypothetical protein
MIWHITRRGFITSLDEPALLKEFSEFQPCLDSLGCKSACTFRVADRQEGRLELFLLSKEGYKKYTLCLKTHVGKITTEDGERHESIDACIKALAPEAISLSQLQDVSLWLNTHGVQYGMPCDLRSVEEKLTKLMDSCPHGAYILYPDGQKGKLRLSRLLHHGGVNHTLIDLTEKPGAYTLDVSKVAYSAAQFRSQISHMGAPVRVK